MLDCDRVQIQISDYLEKGLEPAAHSVVEKHLKGCPECRAIANRIPMVKTMMGNLQLVSCSDDFSQKLHSRISGELPSTLSFAQVKRYSYAISFAVVIFVLFWGVNTFIIDESAPSVNGPVQLQGAVNSPTPGMTPASASQQTPALGSGQEFDVKTAQNANAVVTDSSDDDHSKDREPRIKYVDGTK